MSGFDVNAKSDALQKALDDYDIAFKAWQKVSTDDGGLGRTDETVQSVYDITSLYEQFNSIIDKMYDGIKTEIEDHAYTSFTCVTGITQISPGVYQADSGTLSPRILFD